MVGYMKDLGLFFFFLRICDELIMVSTLRRDTLDFFSVSSLKKGDLMP